jgi:hypothetical protein
LMRLFTMIIIDEYAGSPKMGVWRQGIPGDAQYS